MELADKIQVNFRCELETMCKLDELALLENRSRTNYLNELINQEYERRKEEIEQDDRVV